MRITIRITLGITTKYIDRNPTASMTNNPPSGCHPSNHRVLSCEQQIIALSKVMGTPREGVMSTATSLPSVMKPRFIEPVGFNQTSEGDAC
jgi:hypothetical protein